MIDPVVLVVVPVCARLVYALAALWMRPAKERAWAQALATLVRAAGPGGTVEVTRADGDTLTARSAAVALGPAGTDRP
ncbi:hypothetical protein AB0P17_09930 [Streptomyces sp. NPDC088124]|uniref:hypothetical protein n=1 Tax=Streptomyces sp. NPDC088124 TaxID=3154654 RepID=UPI0034232EBF